MKVLNLLLMLANGSGMPLGMNGASFQGKVEQRRRDNDLSAKNKARLAFKYLPNTGKAPLTFEHLSAKNEAPITFNHFSRENNAPFEFKSLYPEKKAPLTRPFDENEAPLARSFDKNKALLTFKRPSHEKRFH